MEEPWRWHSYYSVSSQSSSVVFQDTLQQQRLPVSTTTQEKCGLVSGQSAFFTFIFIFSEFRSHPKSQQTSLAKETETGSLFGCHSLRHHATANHMSHDIPTPMWTERATKVCSVWLVLCRIPSAAQLLQTFRFCCFARQWIKWNAFQNARSPTPSCPPHPHAYKCIWSFFFFVFSLLEAERLGLRLKFSPTQLYAGCVRPEVTLVLQVRKKKRKTTEVTSSSITFQHDNTKRNTEDFNAVWI